MSVVGQLENFWRPLLEGSLTIMTVKQDGPSLVRRSVVRFHRRTLRKCWETLRNRVSDNQNGCEGRTVVKTMVRHRLRWAGVLGLVQRTLRRSVVCATGRHRGLVLSSSVRTRGTLRIPDELTWSCSVVDLYVSIPTT